MKDFNRQFLDTHRHIQQQAETIGSLKNPPISTFQQIMKEEFDPMYPGEPLDFSSADYCFPLIKKLYEKYDQWLAQEAKEKK